MEALSLILSLLVLAGLAILIVLVMRARGGQDLAVPLAVLREKMDHLDRRQGELSHELRSVQESMSLSLGQAREALRSEIEEAQQAVKELHTTAQARQTLEEETRRSIQRLEGIIAGVSSRGAAGESILEAVLSRLPPEWQEKNLTIGGRRVEFALRLPNQLFVPIDSKWTGTELLERYLATEDSAEQVRLKQEIERQVAARAKEVAKYIDPHRTTPFALAAVPDAIYDLCSGLQVEIYRQRVILIGYSMFLPYLLLLFETSLRASQSLDLEKLEAALSRVESCLKRLQGEVEGRLSTGLRILQNSRAEIANLIGQMHTSVVGLRMSAPEAKELPAEAGEKEE